MCSSPFSPPEAALAAQAAADTAVALGLTPMQVAEAAAMVAADPCRGRSDDMEVTYVYTHEYIYIHIYIYAYSFIHIHIHIHIHIRIHIHIHMHIYIYTSFFFDRHASY